MEYLPEHIRQLLIDKALGVLSSNGEKDLLVWMEAHPEHQCLLDAIKDKSSLAGDIAHMARSGNVWEQSYKVFESRHLLKKSRTRQGVLRRWYAAAAVVLILITAGLGIFRYYTSFKTMPDNSIVAARPFAEIQLSNGQKIPLGNAAVGAVPQLDSVSQLVDTSWYRRLTAGMSSKDSANRMAALSFSIVTPKGGKYALALPDGSKVWMSAASKLHYSQTQDTRQVDMEGEIYFEIAKQAYQKNGKTLWRPFKVQAADMAVEVWGTRFTVSSYPNRTTKTTTLFEGKVKVSKGGQELFLSPGERADLTGGVLSKQNVDNSQGVALKEGYFIFKAETLSDILKEVGNWYDVNIVFQDDQIGRERFEAMLPRSSKLADLLSAIESTGNISFRFKDRTIYVNRK